MIDDRQPPSYEVAVVGGTWQQGNVVPLNFVQPTNGCFNNDSSQQALPPSINVRITAEPPPSYYATVGDAETKVDVTTATAATSSGDETRCESLIKIFPSTTRM